MDSVSADAAIDNDNGIVFFRSCLDSSIFSYSPYKILDSSQIFVYGQRMIDSESLL